MSESKMQNETQTNNQPGFVARGPAAWRNEVEGGAYLTVVAPGFRPFRFTEIPAALRGRKSPMYTGRDGAVWVNQDKQGQNYLVVRIREFAKPLVLFPKQPTSA